MSSLSPFLTSLTQEQDEAALALEGMLMHSCGLAGQEAALSPPRSGSLVLHKSLFMFNYVCLC